MWRAAHPSEDNHIIEMCRDLNQEDPGPKPVPVEHTQRTLAFLRENPIRGQAMVLEISGQIAGYAFLISFWSNELGGEICGLDEFYVRPDFRSQGYGQLLITQLISKELTWSKSAVAIDLEVTPTNTRANKLYSSLGFKAAKNTHMRYRF